MYINIQAQNLPLVLANNSVAMLADSRLLAHLKLKYKFKKLNLSAGTDNGLWHLNSQNISGFVNNSKNRMFNNASFGFDTDFKIHNLNVSLHYSPEFPRLNTVFSNFMLGQDQLLRAGGAQWASWHSRSLRVGYSCSDFEHNISGHINLMFIKNPQAYNSSILTNNNWYIVQNVLGPGSDMQNLDMEINRYLGKKAGNLKLKYRAGRSDMFSRSTVILGRWRC